MPLHIIIPDDSSLSKRFWPKVQKTNTCWLWTAFKDPNGYGKIGTTPPSHHKVLLAHRVSWVIHFGPIPEGLLVCHHCDNPPCVNPAHLFLGTKSDNANDALRKGRLHNSPLKGERHHQAKLKDKDVFEIRKKVAKGILTRHLAEEYDVSQSTIQRVANRTGWSHI